MLYIDLETYSPVDLKAAGVYVYTAHPDFEILMAAWAVDDDPVQVAFGHKDIAAIPGLWDDDVTVVAHNAQFERVCFSRLAGLPMDEFLDPARFEDTMAIAAENGLPQSLANLALALGGEQKDEAGTRLISMFCVPNRKGVRTQPEEKPAEWLDFIDYCVQDVVTLRDVHRSMDGWPTQTERETWVADQRINDAGIRVDLEMAALAVQAAEENRMSHELEVMTLTGVANPGSGPQMLKWFEQTGLELPNLQKETVTTALNGPLTSEQKRVLELRQELALVSSAKYQAALVRTGDDGRLRGEFNFFGAHTGRWSGRGMQLQNLPRHHFDTEQETLEHILHLKLGGGATPDTLKRLVRAVLVGPFTVVDYASIEARVIAWLAGEQWALDAFRAGRDIYTETAHRMGGLTRAQGKIAVLALGYQGAVNSLKVMAGAGIYHGPDGKIRSYGTIGEAQEAGAREFTDKEYLDMVKQWRATNRRIVELWANLQNAVSDTGKVGRHLNITRSNGTVKLHLPSGRAIVYHGIKWSRYRVEDPYNPGQFKIKEGWSYRDPRGRGRIGTYGGRLAENATQAVARDILAAALVRLQERGYAVVGHVHDEVIVEGEHDVEKIAKIMCEGLPWSAGLPIDAEGFTCERYRKG